MEYLARLWGASIGLNTTWQDPGRWNHIPSTCGDKEVRVRRLDELCSHPTNDARLGRISSQCTSAQAVTRKWGYCSQSAKAAKTDRCSQRVAPLHFFKNDVW